MALWQFQCNIIPSGKESDAFSRDGMISWKDALQPEMNIEFLKKEKSWSKNIIQYGNIEETCLEFFFDKNKLEVITCRLDLRSITKDMIVKIVEYIRSIDACILIEDKVYPPELESILPAIKRSKEYQFCKNPIGYLDFLSQSDAK